MGAYDYAMKVIVDANPEAMAQFVLQQYNLLRDVHLPLEGFKIVAQLNTEFQGTETDADGLLLLELPDGRQIMVHMEFQSRRDGHMPDRLIDYCLRARHKYGPLPIICCVIYLRDNGQMQDPPYIWTVIEGYNNLAFDYVSIKMWETPREELLAFQQPALLPLAMLAKGEMNRIIVRDMLEELHANKLNDLIPAGQIIAGWVLKGDDLEWLKKEYHKMTDIFEDSPVIEWIREDAREKAHEEINRQILEERQRALEERQRALERFQQTVVALVAKDFPKLVRMAKKQVRQVEDQERLQRLILRLIVSHNLEEVEGLLLDLDEDEQSAE